MENCIELQEETLQGQPTIEKPARKEIENIPQLQVKGVWMEPSFGVCHLQTSLFPTL
jgi:hypothetical protein